MATISLQKRMNKQITELQMIMEKKRLDDLDEALKQADEQIKAFRLSTKRSSVDLLNQHRFTAKPANLRTDGVDPSKLAEVSRSKLIVSLENRLDHMTVRSSLTEAQNERLKERIDVFRRHRLTANKSHGAMDGAIREVQRRVRGVLERSQAFAEARERHVDGLADLAKHQIDERQRFTDQMASLAAYVAKQNAAFEESLMNSAAATGGRASVDDDEGPLTRGEMTIAEESLKAEAVDQIADQISREKRAAQQTQEKIALYGQSFDQLKRVSGIDNLVEIVRRYVASEEETFSLFNYIQALNQETDWTLERHARLAEDIAAYEEKLSEEEARRLKAMADLQDKWRSAKEATDECSHAALEAQRTLERIAKKVQSLFFKIQCDQVSVPATSKDGKFAAKVNKGGRDSRLALLSSGQGVTESNIVQHAELVEHRALEIMAEYTRKTHAAEQRRVTPVLEPSTSLDITAHLADRVKPPDLEDDLEDDEDEGRPILLDEMRRRTAEKQFKKHKTLMKKPHHLALAAKKSTKALAQQAEKSVQFG
ncbi:hypothetical protein M885DRAFT_431029 [Pelagophyceae sp. CCMP2097]|nr:hypothetical protein M885DRAFT_431029 [Pelagophyceae sp. CCMP2097]